MNPATRAAASRRFVIEMGERKIGWKTQRQTFGIKTLVPWPDAMFQRFDLSRTPIAVVAIVNVAATIKVAVVS